MKPLIVIGDKTSHGGTVITCSSISTTNGKGWARVGDMVSCPRCKGVFPIAQGDNGLRTEGRAVAYDGCKTACGASKLVSMELKECGCNQAEPEKSKRPPPGGVPAY